MSTTKRDIVQRPPTASDDDEMRVVIVRNSDGAQIVDVPSHKPRYTWADEFWWTEGNMGCDCNRALCWTRAHGEPDADDECGHSRFHVILSAPARDQGGDG